MTAVARDIERAAEDVRAANHSTFRGPIDGPESYTVVGNLAELVDRLPQVLDFVVRSLRRVDPVEHYDDRDRDPEPALCRAHGRLDDARALALGMAEQLHHAHNELAHIGRRTTEN